MNYKKHRHSIRLTGYDYAQEGAYFITICTHEKSCIFGHIANGMMYPNQYGQIVCAEWFKTTVYRPYVELATFVVMPNHLHGIIIIRTNDKTTRRGVSHTPHSDACGSDGSGIQIGCNQTNVEFRVRRTCMATELL